MQLAIPAFVSAEADHETAIPILAFVSARETFPCRVTE